MDAQHSVRFLNSIYYLCQVMSGLERQLNEFSDREAEVERLSKDSKERVEEALLLREQVGGVYFVYLSNEL
jgi:hypothetical protein